MFQSCFSETNLDLFIKVLIPVASLTDPLPVVASCFFPLLQQALYLFTCNLFPATILLSLKAK